MLEDEITPDGGEEAKRRTFLKATAAAATIVTGAPAMGVVSAELALTDEIRNARSSQSDLIENTEHCSIASARLDRAISTSAARSA